MWVTRLIAGISFACVVTGAFVVGARKGIAALIRGARAGDREEIKRLVALSLCVLGAFVLLVLVAFNPFVKL